MTIEKPQSPESVTKPEAIITSPKVPPTYEFPPPPPVPQDLARIDQLKASLEKKPVYPEAPPVPAQVIKQTPENVERFLGNVSNLSKGEIISAVNIKDTENKELINHAFAKFGMIPTATVFVAGLGSWIAAAEGVGVSTTLLGLPVTTLLATSAAPAGLVIIVAAGTVWAVRRGLNYLKSSKAREALA